MIRAMEIRQEADSLIRLLRVCDKKIECEEEVEEMKISTRLILFTGL